MASTIPRPAAPPHAAASAAASVFVAKPVVQAANVIRFQVVTERLELYFKGEIPYQASEFANAVFSLAKAIDYSLSINDVPAIAPSLPSVIKQAYKYKNDGSLQSAFMVLMISVKNACKVGWFSATDVAELLSMMEELLNGFSMAINSIPDAVKAQEVISKVMPRFYPNLKLGRLVVAFEAKPGYDILMADFLIPRNIPAEERIRLFVIQTDNLETSVCIVSPPMVSFLVNGKGVERRTNVSLDTGPQFPTDISKMLKYGTNMIQAVGYFVGSYIIAIAFASNLVPSTPTLEDYVQPAIDLPSSDSELIVGASRISLNCLISFRRIKTPVKGYLCKHHQCFDYDNFMEMNSRKPSWRCPCCNQPVSFIDLRIDQNMVKILGEVGDNANDVVINADGSWKVVVRGDGDTDRLRDGTQDGNKDVTMESESDKLNLVTDVMDLTMDEDDDSDGGPASAQGLANEFNSEAEDRKPIKDVQGYSVSEFLSESPAVNSTSSSIPLTTLPRDDFWLRMLASTSVTDGLSTSIGPSAYPIGSLESPVSDAVMNHVATDAVSSGLIQESGAAPEASQSPFPFHLPSRVSPLEENMQLQQSHNRNSAISSLSDRQPIPRFVIRNPIAVQALPVQPQVPVSSQRMRSDIFNTIHVPNGSGGTNVESAASDIQASRSLDNASSLLHAQSRAQSYQNQQQNQYARSSTALPHLVAMPAPSLIVPRTSPAVQQMRTAAQRGLSQTPPGLQNLRAQHTASPVTTTRPLRFPSMPVQQTAQTTAALAAASSARNHQVLASQRAATMARSPAVATPPQISRTPTSIPVAINSPRVSGSEQTRNIAAGGMPGARSNGISESPSETSWRPTGRMRGSLTGSAYAAALSHYLSPATLQPAVARPPIPAAAASDQLLTTASMPSTQSQQTNTGHTEAGRQTGASGV
ncbi:E3 SUMO-protein ligase PIAS1 protein [Dioscorea alata]|uniref:E3 SUMO-protein ligase PIAS1 protein n=1 Tax=Dioscorea alata TaxID=55571 RepID=A0ACB7UD55_DIOAL|nr:E3 SUMO-protein ligase PIAS1 protein [Dioscorea alata]